MQITTFCPSPGDDDGHLKIAHRIDCFYVAKNETEQTQLFLQQQEKKVTFIKETRRSDWIASHAHTQAAICTQFIDGAHSCECGRHCDPNKSVEQKKFSADEQKWPMKGRTRRKKQAYLFCVFIVRSPFGAQSILHTIIKLCEQRINSPSTL